MKSVSMNRPDGSVFPVKLNVVLAAYKPSHDVHIEAAGEDVAAGDTSPVGAYDLEYPVATVTTHAALDAAVPAGAVPYGAVPVPVEPAGKSELLLSGS